jgi:alpha-tubulin suppressor-like RCC1 family protein
VRANGGVACWGNSYDNGNGSKTSKLKPHAYDKAEIVKGVSGCEQVSASYFFGTCARCDGQVKCWNGEGKSASPKPVHTIDDAVDLAVAEYHACVRTANGAIKCWGSNMSGQLGVPIDSVTTNQAGGGGDVVVTAIGGKDAIELEVASGEPCGGCGSTCVRMNDASVQCWGAMGTKDTLTRIALEPR